MFNPFNLYAQAFKNTLQAAQLFIASAQVIQHHTTMMQEVMNGTLSFTHPEFITMWMEKFYANKTTFATMAGYTHNNSLNSEPKQLRAASNLMRPSHQEATPNAKRLRQKYGV